MVRRFGLRVGVRVNCPQEGNATPLSINLPKGLVTTAVFLFLLRSLPRQTFSLVG